MDVQSMVIIVLAVISSSFAVPADKKTLVIDEEALLPGACIPADALKPHPEQPKEETQINEPTLVANSDQISTTLNSDLPNNTGNSRNPSVQNPQIPSPAINQVNINRPQVNPNLQGDLNPPLDYTQQNRVPSQQPSVISPQPNPKQLAAQPQGQPVFNNQPQQLNSLLPYGYYPDARGYNSQANLNQQPNVYNQQPNVYNQLPNAYSQQPNMYNQQPSALNQQPNLYNQQPNVYNQQPNLYTQHANAYSLQPNQQPSVNNMQPNMYNQQPNVYNQPQNALNPQNYGQQPNIYNQQPSIYNQQPNVYNQQPNIYNMPPNVYNQPSNGNNLRPNGYIQPQNVYNQQPNQALVNTNTQNTANNPNFGANVNNPINSDVVPQPNQQQQLYIRVPVDTQSVSNPNYNNNSGYFIPVVQVPSNSGILLSTKIEED